MLRKTEGEEVKRHDKKPKEKLQFSVVLDSTCVPVPAAQCGLQQSGDPHTEEDGPYELTGGPLIEPHAHGLSKEEWHRNCPTETR